MLLFLFVLMAGCTMNEEGKASFAVVFIGLFALAAAIVSFILNLFTLLLSIAAGKFLKEGQLKTTTAKLSSFLGSLFAVLSILASLVLVVANMANYFRCSGGCSNVLGDTVGVFVVSMIPAIIGVLRIKFYDFGKSSTTGNRQPKTN